MTWTVIDPRSTMADAPTTDDDLYLRGAATLLASWEAYATGCAGAALIRRPGVAAAVFPSGPEREVYNNALLDRDLGPAERAEAVDAMAAAYAAVGVDGFAAWVHESDEGLRAELSERGLAVAESSRAMAVELDDLALEPLDPELEVSVASLDEHVRALGLPDGLLSGADPAAFRIVMARRAGEDLATAMAFDHDRDCGVFNVYTVEPARRRGLGTALTKRLLLDARARGCLTASLQSSPIAEGVYAAVGFRDLGRFLEFAPQIPGVTHLPPR
jgi:GNAT superfamily N-acetyltransferase